MEIKCLPMTLFGATAGKAAWQKLGKRKEWDTNSTSGASVVSGTVQQFLGDKTVKLTVPSGRQPVAYQ